MHAAVHHATEVLSAAGACSIVTDVEDLCSRAVIAPVLAFVVEDVARAEAALYEGGARRHGPQRFELDSFLVVIARDRAQIDDSTRDELIVGSGGRAEFAGLQLTVDDDVFWPDENANILYHALLPAIKGQSWKMLDVGCGAGALSLALAHANSQLQVVGTDISASAVDCASANGERLGIRNAQFLCGSLAEPAVPYAPFDTVLANMPWIPPIAVALSSLEHTTWRGPMHTVRGQGDDGLGLTRVLIEQCDGVLKKDGLLFLIGFPWQMDLLAQEYGSNYEFRRAPDPHVLIGRKLT